MAQMSQNMSIAQVLTGKLGQPQGMAQDSG
jgi:hypothetical protein